MFFLSLVFARMNSNNVTSFFKYGFIVPGYDHVSKTMLILVQLMWSFEYSYRTDLLIVSLSISELFVLKLNITRAKKKTTT